MAICSNCGFDNEKGIRKCIICGADLDVEPEKSPADNNDQKNSQKEEAAESDGLSPKSGGLEKGKGPVGPVQAASENSGTSWKKWIAAIIFIIVLLKWIAPFFNDLFVSNSFSREQTASNPTSTRKITNNLAATTKVTTKNVANGIKVTWNKVEGASCYKVYRDDTLILTTHSNEFVDTEVKDDNGVKYTYKVVASTTEYSNEGDSTKSRTSIACRLTTVGIVSITNKLEGRMKVTYKQNPAATGYVLRYSLFSDMSNDMTTSIRGSERTSMSVGDLIKGRTYYVQVRVYVKDEDGNFYSGYCTTKTITITN